MKRTLKDNEIFDQVILPLRVLPQSVPFLAEGGDCGACVMAGLFKIEKIEDVYRDFQKDGEVSNFDWHILKDAFYKAEAYGLLDRFIYDVPLWKYPDFLLSWGLTSWSMSQPWFKYVRMALDAGYYGVTTVNFDKKGVESIMDHIIMICGARSVREDLGGGSAAIHHELLISCSSTRSPAEEWVEVQKFLKMRGGFNIMLVRTYA